MKSAKQLERYFKGVSNHHRINILLLLSKERLMTLDEIAGNLNVNLKTVSEHTKKLVQAGLLNKEYSGRFVFHSLSPYGKSIVDYFKTFK
jgi:predicted transcriptional regulator